MVRFRQHLCPFELRLVGARKNDPSHSRQALATAEAVQSSRCWGRKSGTPAKKPNQFVRSSSPSFRGPVKSIIKLHSSRKVLVLTRFRR